MKNNTAIPILLVLLGLILTAPACKKYTGPRTLTAQAVDKTTLQPVPDTWLYLLRTEKDNTFNISLSPGEIMEVKQADAQGKAEFTFDFEEEYSYAFYALNEDGYGYNQEFIPYKQLTGEVKLWLQPTGYIKLKVVNKFPVDNEDQINIGLQVNGSFPTLKGSSVDTLICCGGGDGNVKEKLYWWVYKNGKEDKTDSIKFYLPAHDTTLVTIEY